MGSMFAHILTCTLWFYSDAKKRRTELDGPRDEGSIQDCKGKFYYYFLIPSYSDLLSIKDEILKYGHIAMPYTVSI